MIIKNRDLCQIIKKSIFPKANSSVPKNKTLKLFERFDVVENSLVH